ncbi:Pre-mRNA-splicing factor cwc24 [Penicillium atrosanguineum]|nr:Pre-mRNA-splicing factor cwc24 [Penicillium atrosanguineum]
MAEETKATEAVPQFGFKKRSSKAKANFRKKPATPPPASDSDFTSSDDEEGRRIKRRRKNVAVTASSATNAARKETSAEQPSAGPAPLTSSNDATKSANWHDEDLSAKNLLGSTRARPRESQEAAGLDGTYKGAANYTSFIQKNPDAPTKQFGPIKAPTNVRTVTVMDFAPDVCKDYKQTGFCGFGDSCKFLHAREDYKQGWELDRDWEVGTNGKKLVGRVVSQRKGAGMAERRTTMRTNYWKAFRLPASSSCALNRYRKNPSCAACGAGTGGVFNVAKKLTALLDKKRERARKQREEALANGEEVSDEEEEDSD